MHISLKQLHVAITLKQQLHRTLQYMNVHIYSTTHVRVHSCLRLPIAFSVMRIAFELDCKLENHGWNEVQTLHPKDDIEGRGGREVGEHGFVDCSSGEGGDCCNMNMMLRKNLRAVGMRKQTKGGVGRSRRRWTTWKEPLRRSCTRRPSLAKALLWPP